ATRAMKWAKDFRMDAPWSQQGENSSNPWSDKGKFRVGGVAVMVDNFAIPAATIRGLFDYEYRCDRLIIRPRIPGSITQYTQVEPIHFGEKTIFLSCNNGGPDVKSVTINGQSMNISSASEVSLFYNELPQEAKIEITTDGGWPKEISTAEYPKIPALTAEFGNTAFINLPESLKKSYATILALNKSLANQADAEYDHAFLREVLKSYEDCGIRLGMDPGPGYYRPITPERKDGINKFYEQTALSMYSGFAKRMTVYAEKGDEQQKQIANLFFEAQK
ncbi:MAG: hypothetical protein WCI54_18530, partial [Bacteroidia bacterium]